MAAKTAKKPTAKKNTAKAKASAAQPRDVAAMRRRNTIISWILIGLSIVLVFVVAIPFDSVWMWIHNGILGMFGYLSFFVPILLGYLGISLGMGKTAKPHTLSRTILILVIMAAACSIAYAFQYGDAQAGKNFFDNLGELFVKGTQWQSAGLFSGLMGIPFVAMFGGGAKIITVVLLIVLILVFTGVTAAQMARAARRSTQKVRSSISSVKESAAERREVRRNTRAVPVQMRVPEDAEDLDVIDIPLEGEDREAMKEASARRSKEKLDNLRRAFNMPFDEEPVIVRKETREKKEPPKPEQLEEITRQPEKIAARKKAAEKKLTEKQPSERKTASAPAEKKNEYIDIPVEEDTGAAAAAEAYMKKMQQTQSEELAQAVQETSGDREAYRFPPMDLLKSGKPVNNDDVTMELQVNGQKLVDVLKSFGVQTRILDISRGPAVTRYELQPAAGVKISKITNLSDDIAMNLAASGVRIEAPIPGKAAVGVEVPNQNVSVVKMRELIESAAFRNAKSKLTVALGRDISGKIVLADLAKMPHLLIAGSTGSGKSVCINSLIISLLYKASPDEVKLLMVDPKVVELGIYNGIPHLLVPVVTDPRKAAGALGWAVTEMLNRYKIFADNNVRDLHGYNELVGDGLEREDGVKLEPMPQVVIIIDELADLMMAAPNEVEDSICRLAQMARAAGMHLVIATQRPSVDVITGVIKANIPSRIAFAVSSQIDSRTILDGGGAEKLLGRGDMLFAPVGTPKPQRVQGCFVDDKEVEKITAYVKKKHDSDYDAAVIEEIEKNAAENKAGKEEEQAGGISSDPVMPEAIKCVVEAGQASTSLLQRRLRLGYARAGRLIDEMEQMGVVGPHEGSKPRQVLITYQQWLEMSMQQNDEKNDAKSGAPEQTELPEQPEP